MSTALLDSGPHTTRRYHRHEPEKTALYEVIDATLPAFRSRLEAGAVDLPRFVKREFDDYLACGRLEHGFVRVKCNGCRHEHLVAFSCKRRGFCPSCGARRMVETSAHLVDHVFPSVPVRQWVLSFPFPLRFLFAARSEALSRCLAVVVRAIETDLIRRAGLTRASGARTGVVTLIQRFGSALNLNVHLHMLVLDGVYTFEGGFSLNAAVACPAHRRDRLERLCRYVTRPAIALERLSLNRRGEVLLALKRPFRDGTTHLRFSAEDFVARLAALVPRPRANLTRYHGVFAPAFPWRALVTGGSAPASARRAGCAGSASHSRQRHRRTGRQEDTEDKADARAPLTWAQRLKRVFAIDITQCPHCGGRLRVITDVTDPEVIERILEHVRRERLPRAPPSWLS